MDRQALAKSCERVPLFPLPGAVFLPHTVMPLHVFEQRYQDLIYDALRRDSIIGIPQLAEGWEAHYDERPPILPIAGVGRIIRSEQLRDGRYNIAVLGLGRIRIEEELPSQKRYRLARATLLADQLPPGGVPELEKTLAHLKSVLGQLMMIHPRLQEELGKMAESSSTQMIDALGHLVIRDTADRQRYIEEDRLQMRANAVIAGLAEVLTRFSGPAAEA